MTLFVPIHLGFNIFILSIPTSGLSYLHLYLSLQPVVTPILLFIQLNNSRDGEGILRAVSMTVIFKFRIAKKPSLKSGNLEGPAT